jgi:hypothetical protein
MLRFAWIALLCAAPLAAQTPPSPFQPLEFLVGHCWTGTFPGGKKTDTHCFEWMMDGKFIRDRHTVRGGAPYEGETIWAFDPKQKKVVYHYFASDGAISSGTLNLENGDMVFPEEYVSAGVRKTMKNVWSRNGRDAYDVWAAEKTAEGSWKEMFRMTLRRVPKE